MPFPQNGPQNGPPQGQPQGGHPTVTYGLPGGDQAVVLPQHQAPGVQRGQGAYQQQGYSVENIPPMPHQQFQQSAQQGGWPQPPQQQPAQQQQQPQPQQQFQQQPSFGQQQYGQPQPQQQPQHQQLTHDTVLDGPGVPAELRGRQFGQVMQIYTALAQDWMERQGQARRAGQASPNQPQPQMPQGGPQGGQPTQDSGQQRRFNWQDPDGSFRQIVREEVGPLLQPIQQRSQAESIAQARMVASQGIPDFAQLEGDVMQSLVNASPELLAKPDTWVAAADYVRGRRVRGGQTQQQPYGQSYGQQAQPNPMGNLPPQSQFGPRSVPAAPPHQFFTEGPTPPSQFYQQGGAMNPTERLYAQRMGMSDQEYLAWRGGVQR